MLYCIEAEFCLHRFPAWDGIDPLCVLFQNSRQVMERPERLVPSISLFNSSSIADFLSIIADGLAIRGSSEEGVSKEGVSKGYGMVPSIVGDVGKLSHVRNLTSVESVPES